MKYDLPKSFSGVTVISSEASDGPMNYFGHGTPQNPEKFAQKAAPRLPFASMGQIHEIKINIIDKPGRAEECDGILTRENFILGVKTADCIPLLLFEKKSGMIGALHISRKNLLAGIITKSLACELKKLKAGGCELEAFLGPHIRVKSYSLKTEDATRIAVSPFSEFLVKINGREHFDLTEAAISKLVEIGLKRDNIYDCGIDTFADKRFYSSRKSSQQGVPPVFLSVICKNEK